MALIVANLRRPNRNNRYHPRKCSICGTEKEPLIPKIYRSGVVVLYCEKDYEKGVKMDQELLEPKGKK